jgi:DNA repair exonuclease SbcCD ATPase subunit
VILDAQAQEEIKKELDWLESELEEAVQNNDLERANHIRAQKEDILEHLSQASSIFGRSRQFSDDGEKARKRVAAAIRRTVEAIEKENTDLWRHLKSCIKTGYSCSYEPLEDIEWSF